MQTTIARKKHSDGITFIVFTVLGIGLVVYGLIEGQSFLWFVGVVLAIVFGGFAIRYLLLPSDIIVLSEEGSLILPKGRIIPIETVCVVSYKWAYGRGVRLDWGTVTLSTHEAKYKFGFVADCENVAKALKELMCAAKQDEDV